jgi:hypothetical protein
MQPLQPNWLHLPQPLPLQRPELPILVQKLARPSLPVGMLNPTTPGLPMVAMQPALPGLPMGVLTPAALPIPLAGSGQPPSLWVVEQPWTDTPTLVSDLDASNKKSSLPVSSPTTENPSLLQLLPLEGTAGAKQTMTALASPLARITQEVALRSRTGSRLAVPPLPALPEMVLPVSEPSFDAETGDLFAGSGPSSDSGLDLEPADIVLPPVPGAVLPSQPLALLSGLPVRPL